MNNRINIYVGNLPYTTTESAIRDLFLLWFLTGYRMLDSMHQHHVQRAVQLQTTSEQLKTVQQEIGLLEKEIKHNELVLADACALQIFAPNFFIQKILDTLQTNNLHLQAYTPERNESKGWYTKHTIRIDCTGNYRTIFSFLSYWATVQLPIICTYMHLEKKQNSMYLSCSMSYYQFIKDEHEK